MFLSPSGNFSDTPILYYYHLLCVTNIITLILTMIGCIMSFLIAFSILNVEAQSQDITAVTAATVNTTISASSINVTIGDLILESFDVPLGIRVPDAKMGQDITEPDIESSYIGNSTLRGGINATNVFTVNSVTKPDGTIHSEGQGILISTTTGEIATYTFNAMGQFGNDGKLRNHGPVFFYTNSASSGQFFFLKNMIGVFADEIDTAGNDMTKVWELN
jgi:hypothetical protein